jgi:hypothetical protein
MSFSMALVTNSPSSNAGTIAGDQSACNTATPLIGLTSVSNPVAGVCTTVPLAIQWQSSTDNISFTNITGANSLNYTIPAILPQTTYYRRAYRTYCDTVFSNTITVNIFNGPQGTPNTFGNGVWNAFVYNSNDYSSNYSGFYTTGSGLSYNTTTDFVANQAPSRAPGYQGCPVNPNLYSVRFQRTNFPLGVYQIGIGRNNDDMAIILNGINVYNVGGNGGVRPNVWTGTLGPNSNLEIRYRNNAASGDINWTITQLSPPVYSTAGTIAGNQVACNSAIPSFGLTSVAAPTQGSCTLIPNAIQWQSSTDNVTFTNIPGGNLVAYTIPAILSQTTYFRRAYRTYCDTLYSNTVTVTIYNGAQGTPNTFGNGLWNAYVYNANDYSSNYSGYYTTGSGLNYNSTTDYTVNQAPSLAPTYQGCQVNANVHSVRYQRTNFPLGVYQIGVGRNDDDMSIILNGVTVYSSGTNTGARANVWTGTLGGNSNLEIRYRNTGGPGDISWTFTLLAPPTYSSAGSIAGNQAICSNTTPTGLTSGSAATQGSCSLIPVPYQWESSTNNLVFTAISGANGLTYTIPGPLSQTTYYRRAYRTYCDTIYSNVITKTVTTLPTPTISYPGSPVCRSAGGNLPVSLSGTPGGTFSSTAGLSINSGSGSITLASSSVGSYTVTYTVAASGGCPLVTTTTGVVLNPDVSAPSAPSGSTAFCQNSTIAFTTSATNATGYSWSVSGAGNSISGSGSSVNAVFDPAFSGSATISVSALGCGGPVGPVSTNVTVNPNGYWVGGTTNWNLAGNWCGGIPTPTTDVIIPTGATNMPQINGASFANNLTLQNGTSLTINAANSLTISGSATGNGSLLPSASSTVNYNGDADQPIFRANYANLNTSGTGTKTWPASGTTRISGSFNPGTSGHIVTGSTIEFNRAGAQNIPAFTFHNLVTSGNAVKTMTGNILVGGSATLTNGSLAIGANTLDLGGTIAGSGTLTGNCSSVLTISGPGSTGTLNFTAGSRILGNLNLSKSAAGNVLLGTDLDICTNLNLGTGKVVIGAHDLTLLTGATTTAGNPNSYVQTLDQMSPSGAGFFIQEVPNSSGELVFPVGTVESYTPAYLDNIGFGRNFRVRVFNGVFEHGITGAPVLNADFSVLKTWEIEPFGAGGTPDVNIKLQWNTGDEGIHFPYHRQSEKIYIGKNVGIGSSIWDKMLTDEKNLAASPYTISTARVTSFSKFAVGSDEAPLPIRMGPLSVATAGKTRKLSWTTYSEANSIAFEILRSTDGNQFQTIGSVKAAGQSTDQREYSFTDAELLPVAFYKIRFVGEGEELFSNTVRVVGTETFSFQAFPNPATDQIRVQWDAPIGGAVEAVLRSMDGKALPLQVVAEAAGHLDLNLSGLPAGLYWIEVQSGGVLLGKTKISKR